MRIPSLPSLALPLLLFGAIFGAALGAGCGKEIGDACVVSSDCSPNGDRQCLDPSQNGGYCTIQGCDFGTCPDEAVCVRFFTGGFSNKPCDYLTEDNGSDACSFDELCSLAGTCVPRSSEIRFCMRTCGGDGDCRGDYECRDFDLMVAHGGEPVLDPAGGQRLDAKSAQSFCAATP